MDVGHGPGEDCLYVLSEGGLRIPFLCQRCGKCCREVSVRLQPEDIGSIYSYLGLDTRRFVRRYMPYARVARSGEIEYDTTTSCAPCPFLRQENICTVYPVRPRVCQWFPVHSDGHASRIGCPGYQVMLEARRKVGRAKASDRSQLEGAYRRLEKGGLPVEWLARFAQLNRL